MGTAELVGWSALAIGFAGAFGIFATHRALRRLGTLAMGAGLMVFALVALHTALDHALGDNPALPIIWIVMVPTISITITWLTRYFYRDLDLYGLEDSYHSDTEEIAP